MNIDVDKLLKKDLNGIYWDLSFNGESIDFERKNYIRSIELSETVKGADTLTIQINDPDMVFIEDDFYLKDVPVSFDMWFHGYTEKASFYGYISEINIDFAEDGLPILELYCLDKTHLMQRVKNTQTWNNVRSIDVVREKCEGYGWKLVYPEDYEFLKEDSISQSDQTDIEFLEQLAGNERELFIAKLIGDTFFYIRLGLLSEPVANLYYRVNAEQNNVKSFTPTIDKETKKVDERYADIDPVTLDVDNYYANQSTVALQSQGYPIEVSAVTYGSVRYDDSGNKKESSGSNSTERKYRDVDYNTLRGDCQLMPKGDIVGMRYMTTVNFFGLGKYLSGTYYVEGLTRTLDSENAYSQSATLIKTGFAESIKTPVKTDEVGVSEYNTNFVVGDHVRIVNENAVYAHEDEGVKIPNYVRAVKTLTVKQVDSAGNCVLIDEIYSWVHMQDIEKV